MVVARPPHGSDFLFVPFDVSAETREWVGRLLRVALTP